MKERGWHVLRLKAFSEKLFNYLYDEKFAVDSKIFK